MPKNFTDTDELASFLQIPESAVLKKSTFSLNMPFRLAEKIEKGRLDDPLLRQFLPTSAEQTLTGENDPVHDSCFQKTPKLLQKYKGRALLITSGACAMHCRFCFRQNYSYPEPKDFEKELTLLANDDSIDEIILSGGDPLSLSNDRLKTLIESLNQIPHIRRIRFHTRFPLALPSRIDKGFLALLEASSKQIIFMIHTNCHQELGPDLFDALKKITRLGIPVLSQTVLLRGVNDSVESLKKLFLDLANHGIIPYYLHQLDPVRGSLHFEVPVEEGRALMKALQAELPGYALPAYVKEEPFKPSKTTL